MDLILIHANPKLDGYKRTKLYLCGLGSEHLDFVYIADVVRHNILRTPHTPVEPPGTR
jgi:hypothetical protein